MSINKTKLCNISSVAEYYSSFSIISQYDSNFKLEAARSYSKHCEKTGELEFLIKARQKINRDRSYNTISVKSEYKKCMSFGLFSEAYTRSRYSFKD